MVLHLKYELHTQTLFEQNFCSMHVYIFVTHVSRQTHASCVCVEPCAIVSVHYIGIVVLSISFDFNKQNVM